jgi:hypothetical protein
MNIKWRSFRSRSFLPVLFLSCFLSGYLLTQYITRPGEHTLVGRWKTSPSANSSIHFFSDHKFVQEGGGGRPIRGSWKALGTAKFMLVYEPSLGSSAPAELKQHPLRLIIWGSDYVATYQKQP